MIGTIGTTHSVQQRRPCVVTNSIGDSVVLPCSKRISISKSSDCWGHNTLGAEPVRSGEPHLRQPPLIPDNLPGHIKVRGIILVLMGKGV